MPVSVAAETIDIRIADLDEALAGNRRQNDSVQRLVLDNIEQKLREAGLQFEGGALLIEDDIVNETVDDGCTRTIIQQLRTEARLAESTGLSFSFESMSEPVTLDLVLDASISASGTAKQIVGLRLGSCRELATDSFSVTASGPLSLRLTLSLELNPQRVSTDSDGVLRLRPELTVSGELQQARIDVDVDDSLVRRLLEDRLQTQVDDLLSPASFNSELDGLQQRLDEQLSDALDDNGDLLVTLPDSDDAQISALYEALAPRARFPLTLEFIRQHRVELLAALILNDSDTLDDLLSDALVCQLSSALQVDLPRPVLYSNDSGACEIADDNRDGVRYTDDACSASFNYFVTGYADYCATALDAERLGNAASRVQELNRWSFTPGTAFDIGALTIEGKRQPLVQRRSYRRVSTAGGLCDLEMRVYTDRPDATGKKSLIALHGGSWQNRGSGFLGVENMATHFVDAGFVVFAPFYRLLSDSDGTPACHNATLDELMTDTTAAFEWVEANQQSYGASGRPVLFGQSAGGHIAQALAVANPTRTDRTILFYAPTDFRDFAEQILDGSYVGDDGRRILETVIQTNIDTLDLNSSLVRRNSFPAIVETAPLDYPASFLLHGESDSLLPSRQSVRLCNAYAGSLQSGPATEVNSTLSLRRVFACGTGGSQLHLVAEGEHTLDLCLADGLCLSGSPASAAKTADSIRHMLTWSVADDPANAALPGTGSGGSGALDRLLLGLLWCLLAGLAVLRRCSGRQYSVRPSRLRVESADFTNCLTRYDRRNSSLSDR